MLNHRSALISPSYKRRCVPSHVHTNRQLSVACSAEGSNNKQTGWHWPFSKKTAGDDIETEIVYVTDTAEADEVIEEPEYIDDVEQVQLGDQTGAETSAGAAAVAAEDDDVLQQEQLPGQHAAPLRAEPAATQVRSGLGVAPGAASAHCSQHSAAAQCDMPQCSHGSHTAVGHGTRTPCSLWHNRPSCHATSLVIHAPPVIVSWWTKLRMVPSKPVYGCINNNHTPAFCIPLRGLFPGCA